MLSQDAALETSVCPVIAVQLKELLTWRKGFGDWHFYSA